MANSSVFFLWDHEKDDQESYQKAEAAIQDKHDEIWPVFEQYKDDYEYFHSDDTDSDAYIMKRA